MNLSIVILFVWLTISLTNGQCSDSLLTAMFEEILSLKSTVDLLEYRLNEMESTDSCSCDTTSTSIAGIIYLSRIITLKPLFFASKFYVSCVFVCQSQQKTKNQKAISKFCKKRVHGNSNLIKT